MANISKELFDIQKNIEKIAADYGLDFFETVFEMVTYKQMNQIAAYGGFPIRYPHWRFGMEYESLSKGYEYGLSKIYELVINNDPCYAYLLEGNSLVDQKLVMAHVYGHCDFFKNNKWFANTDRKMMDTMANHAVRVRRFIDRYGIEEVENFIDTCLSIENLIDRHALDHFNLKSYKNEGDEPSAEKDILRFLIDHAPIEDWKKDILHIIRTESYYFAPQGMTKIMNEGWASYWHSKMMTQDICNDSEIVQFADVHSGTMAMNPHGFNPYKIGIELFRDIENRWNKGRFGREWSQCENLQEKANWDLNLGQGRDKIFQVRRDYNDVGFIDEFLTEEFCVEHKMFVYKFNKKSNQFEVDTRDFKAIKSKLLFQIANFGQPIISVVDKNFGQKGELLLSHLFEGVELQPDYMRETMSKVYEIWRSPINIATVLDKEAKIVRYNGEEFEVLDFDKG
ncbi:MAG: SpoVR family protein [Bdellovibrionaceae bacterium]|nr:SpoVR family protein [Pseudobdellovibrionaceae bacterium]